MLDHRFELTRGYDSKVGVLVAPLSPSYYSRCLFAGASGRLVEGLPWPEMWLYCPARTENHNNVKL